MSSLAVVQDVRVHHDVDIAHRRLMAAKSAMKFLRRQAEYRKPENKDELVSLIWKLYWRARRSHLLEAPRTTKRMLREKYGSWKVVGVKTPAHQ